MADSHTRGGVGKPLSSAFRFFANKSAGFEPMRPPPDCGSSDCGSAAFLVPNDSAQPRNSTVFFADLGYDSTQQAVVRDAVARQDLSVFTGSFTALLGTDESRLLIITPGSTPARRITGSATTTTQPKG